MAKKKVKKADDGTEAGAAADAAPTSPDVTQGGTATINSQIGNPFGKANPDEKEDAQLGEDVEHLVEEHFEQNKDAEAKEGHKMSVKKKLDDKIKAMKKASAHLQEQPKEPYTEDVNILEQVKRNPKDTIKEKIGVLKEMAAFLKSIEDESDVQKAYVGFEKLKNKIAASGSAENPAAVAAAIGNKKYGKAKMQAAAHAGKKLKGK